MPAANWQPLTIDFPLSEPGEYQAWTPDDRLVWARNVPEREGAARLEPGRVVLGYPCPGMDHFVFAEFLRQESGGGP